MTQTTQSVKINKYTLSVLFRIFIRSEICLTESFEDFVQAFASTLERKGLKSGNVVSKYVSNPTSMAVGEEIKIKSTKDGTFDVGVFIGVVSGEPSELVVFNLETKEFMTTSLNDDVELDNIFGNDILSYSIIVSKATLVESLTSLVYAFLQDASNTLERSRVRSLITSSAFFTALRDSDKEQLDEIEDIDEAIKSIGCVFNDGESVDRFVSIVDNWYFNINKGTFDYVLGRKLVTPDNWAGLNPAEFDVDVEQEHRPYSTVRIPQQTQYRKIDRYTLTCLFKIYLRTVKEMTFPEFVERFYTKLSDAVGVDSANLFSARSVVTKECHLVPSEEVVHNKSGANGYYIGYTRNGTTLNDSNAVFFNTEIEEFDVISICNISRRSGDGIWKEHYAQFAEDDEVIKSSDVAEQELLRLCVMLSGRSLEDVKESTWNMICSYNGDGSNWIGSGFHKPAGNGRKLERFVILDHNLTYAMDVDTLDVIFIESYTNGNGLDESTSDVWSGPDDKKLADSIDLDKALSLAGFENIDEVDKVEDRESINSVNSVNAIDLDDPKYVAIVKDVVDAISTSDRVERMLWDSQDGFDTKLIEVIKSVQHKFNSDEFYIFFERMLELRNRR